MATLEIETMRLDVLAELMRQWPAQTLRDQNGRWLKAVHVARIYRQMLSKIEEQDLIHLALENGHDAAWVVTEWLNPRIGDADEALDREAIRFARKHADEYRAGGHPEFWTEADETLYHRELRRELGDDVVDRILAAAEQGRRLERGGVVH
jgi:hypothetical protein